ncbi:MAG: hypothetical protein JWM72_2125 [Actinomycetia bacterium]|nr:hypothetical protein [Actinomycetes bacterium]MDQ1462476.1 hypothetical protein [Actinomycetota bacterium]
MPFRTGPRAAWRSYARSVAAMLDGEPHSSPMPGVPRRPLSSPLFFVVCLGVVLGACTSGGSKATPDPSPTSTTTRTQPSTATTPTSPLENLYLQLLGPADAASGKFFTALKALPVGATGADAEKFASPAADAIERADRQLLGVTWPGKLGRDVHALVTANGRLVVDLRNLASQKTVTTGPWPIQFERDVGIVFDRATVIQADFHGSSGLGK